MSENLNVEINLSPIKGREKRRTKDATRRATDTANGESFRCKGWPIGSAISSFGILFFDSRSRR